MKDKFSRRDFIAVTGATAASCSFLMADETPIDPEVVAELKNRMKFLSPPDGIASDLDTRPSPKAVPFSTDLFVPKIARPLINLTDDSLWIAKEKADGSETSLDLNPEDDKELSTPKVKAFLE